MVDILGSTIQTSQIEASRYSIFSWIFHQVSGEKLEKNGESKMTPLLIAISYIQ